MFIELNEPVVIDVIWAGELGNPKKQARLRLREPGASGRFVLSLTFSGTEKEVRDKIESFTRSVQQTLSREVPQV